ncbi:MAG TPA: hypothetical protein ENH82_09875 [bacterium]|nr:hypothetical protein [bacterium]
MEKNFEAWELSEHLDALFLQNEVFKNIPIPVGIMENWTQEQFTKAMWGVIKAYEVDRDNT